MSLTREVGLSVSTDRIGLDFETYSEAGYYFDPDKNKWVSVTGSNQTGGLNAVGSAVYSEHPSTRVICLWYRTPSDNTTHFWMPGMPNPTRLFEAALNGELISAFNSMFEFLIWTNVCVPKYGWPPIPIHALIGTEAKSNNSALPPSLGGATKAVGVPTKLDEGKALIKLLSCPHHPQVEDDGIKLFEMYAYCRQDVIAEARLNLSIEDLTPFEYEVWKLDQEINYRGVPVDTEAVNAVTVLWDEMEAVLNHQMYTLTGGSVDSPSKLKKLIEWLRCSEGLDVETLDKNAVPELLKRKDLTSRARSALTLRDQFSSSSVKKAYSMQRMTCKDGRIRGLLAYSIARTRRWAGRGPQPQNFPNDGPNVMLCSCGKYYGKELDTCPWCSNPSFAAGEQKWCAEAMEDAIFAIKRGLTTLWLVFPDVSSVAPACLRGLIKASEGKEFICSDFSAIEAVVLAEVAGEEWRIEVFKTHGKIYEMSASKISGVPFEEIIAYKEQTGQDHPLRKKLGKVSELASGYQGGYGAWVRFGADEFMSEQEIRDGIKKWRKESPMVEKLWYELERCAVSAVQCPGQCFSYRGITYGVKDDILYCQLLSGECIKYRQPMLENAVTPFGRPILKLSFMGYNSTNKKWERIDTYGGKLTENVVQGVARDILAHSLLNLTKHGYDVVFHVHDEIIAEIPKGTGDLAHFEKVMAEMPDWCKDWPVKASGGWIGERYRK